MAILCEGRIVKNFSIEEMANNESKKDVKLVLSEGLTQHARMMQDLRNWYAKSMKVNSWYREVDYNAKVGGDANSCHLDGIATDVALPRLSLIMRTRFISKWKAICKAYGVIGGVSIYTWGLHFDSNNTPTRYGRVSTTFRITDFR
jgi:uncharacterized protein YcbK (DUF882 family)